MIQEIDHLTLRSVEEKDLPTIVRLFIEDE